MPSPTDTTLVRRAGNTEFRRNLRQNSVPGQVDAADPAAPLGFYDRPRFESASGRTVGFLDRHGMQRLAEEHEFMRDRIVRLELENALLRSVVDVTRAHPASCAEPATA